MAEEASGDRCCSPNDACGCDIADKLGVAPATVSYHMKALVEAGLVTPHKRGLWVFYRLVPDAVEALVAEVLASLPDSSSRARPTAG